MISYEDALKKAKELKPDTDHCIEYDNAYIFACHEDNGYEGTRQPCVILRKDGRAVALIYYLTKVGVGKKVREMDV